MALVTPADIAAATRMTLTSGSADFIQAQVFCDFVSLFISELSGYSFDNATATERLQADYDGIIALPRKPVVEVVEVKTVSGAIISTFYWNGLDEIDGLEAHQVVDVEYDAGFTSPPDVLKKIAIAAASRQMLNPSGIRQQTIGAISETFGTPGAVSGAVYFSSLELQILNKYATTMDTWRLGPRVPTRLSRQLPTL